MQTISYYVITATAGHDTTASAMAGGMQALIEHPDQLARLQADPIADRDHRRRDDPLGHAGEALHAHRDAGLPTCAVAPSPTGQSVLLSYPSANRDEEVFTDPFRFDIGRSPNKHLAFGFGVHFCLGAMLARMELKALFTELVPRLRSVAAGRRARADEDAVRRRAEAVADSLRGRARRLSHPSTSRCRGSYSRCAMSAMAADTSSRGRAARRGSRRTRSRE